jgi:hypothetical protein
VLDVNAESAGARGQRCVSDASRQALELRFIRGFDDADDGRFTRAAGR